jgi:hypothetical protein
MIPLSQKFRMLKKARARDGVVLPCSGCSFFQSFSENPNSVVFFYNLTTSRSTHTVIELPIEHRDH